MPLFMIIFKEKISQAGVYPISFVYFAKKINSPPFFEYIFRVFFRWIMKNNCFDVELLIFSPKTIKNHISRPLLPMREGAADEIVLKIYTPVFKSSLTLMLNLSQINLKLKTTLLNRILGIICLVCLDSEIFLFLGFF